MISITFRWRDIGEGRFQYLEKSVRLLGVTIFVIKDYR